MDVKWPIAPRSTQPSNSHFSWIPRYVTRNLLFCNTYENEEENNHKSLHAPAITRTCHELGPPALEAIPQQLLIGSQQLKSSAHNQNLFRSGPHQLPTFRLTRLNQTSIGPSRPWPLFSCSIFLHHGRTFLSVKFLSATPRPGYPASHNHTPIQALCKPTVPEQL